MGTLASAGRWGLGNGKEQSMGGDQRGGKRMEGKPTGIILTVQRAKHMSA